MKKQIISEEFKRMQKLAGIKINENIIVNKNNNQIEIKGDSGSYVSFIEDDGTVTFSVYYDNDNDFELNDDNWKDILGQDHVFTQLYNLVGGNVEALGDYISITLKSDDILNKFNK